MSSRSDRIAFNIKFQSILSLGWIQDLCSGNSLFTQSFIALSVTLLQFARLKEDYLLLLNPIPLLFASQQLFCQYRRIFLCVVWVITNGFWI